MRNGLTAPIVVVMAASVALAGVSVQGATRGPTVMYRASEKIGSIEPTRIRAYPRAEVWDIACPDGESQVLTRGRNGRQRARINLHHWDGGVDGYAQNTASGRWLIYRWYGNPASPPVPLGSAVRESPWRWDVFRAKRKIGRTVGPDGPAAATALVMVCA
jgi:hypothetical protein